VCRRVWTGLECSTVLEASELHVHWMEGVVPLAGRRKRMLDGIFRKHLFISAKSIDCVLVSLSRKTSLYLPSPRTLWNPARAPRTGQVKACILGCGACVHRGRARLPDFGLWRSKVIQPHGIIKACRPIPAETLRRHSPTLVVDFKSQHMPFPKHREAHYDSSLYGLTCSFVTSQNRIIHLEAYWSVTLAVPALTIRAQRAASYKYVRTQHIIRNIDTWLV
jgi:hypothetical protein